MSEFTGTTIWTSQGRTSAALEVYLLGTVDFDAAMALQERLAVEISARSDRLGALILCEHPAIVTVGRDGRITDLPVDTGDFTARRMEIVRVNRGGGTLVHAPGQVAAYPILPLERLNCDFADFQNRLQAAIVETATERRVSSRMIETPLGTICRCGQLSWIGTSVRDGVSGHGLFLNVSPVLDTVRLVRSTADGVHVASLSMQRMEPVPMQKVRESLMRHISSQFGYEETHPYTGHPMLKRTWRKVMQHA
ncbi:MAG: hypothetical protein HQ518_28640 [Rhodopirellula sp.]|nr:hypothetical protein [Rhodopirellula sp.]